MTFSPMYEQQVRLLLKVLPEVAKITAFAMHGGTAINLFHRNLPRLSVDIDLTYIPIKTRAETLQNIAELLLCEDGIWIKHRTPKRISILVYRIWKQNSV